MNLKQAAAVNDLIADLMPHAATLGGDVPDHLAPLVKAAYKRLATGWSPDRFRAEWDKRAAEGAPA